jgi:CRP/FNR family transcriptional regulator, cyclic AMP receptor protein
MTVILSAIERIVFLKQVTFFQGMSIDQLKVLAGICEEELIPRGTTIFEEGEPGGVLYMVVNGHVAIERRGEHKGDIVRLATMKAYSSFGEMSLFNNYPRSASAITIEDTLVLKLKDKQLMILMRQYPDMSLELIKVLSMRMRETNDQLMRVTRTKSLQVQQLYEKLEESDEE